MIQRKHWAESKREQNEIRELQTNIKQLVKLLIMKIINPKTIWMARRDGVELEVGDFKAVFHSQPARESRCNLVLTAARLR